MEFTLNETTGEATLLISSFNIDNRSINDISNASIMFYNPILEYPDIPKLSGILEQNYQVSARSNTSTVLGPYFIDCSGYSSEEIISYLRVLKLKFTYYTIWGKEIVLTIPIRNLIIVLQ